MNRDDEKYLKTRIDAARATKRDKYTWGRQLDAKMPPNVRAAQRVLKKWHNKQSAFYDKQKIRVDKAAQVAREALILGDPKAALKAIKKFEAMTF